MIRRREFITLLGGAAAWHRASKTKYIAGDLVIPELLV
jgi:hypothetical protein